MKKNTAVFRGLAAIMAFVMLVSMTAATITFQYDGIINTYAGIDVTRTEASDDTVSTAYYENEYGSDADALVDAYAAAADLNIESEEEAIVLLKNEDDALPISSDSRLTIFGNASVNSSIYSTQSPDYMTYTSFVDAMEDTFGADNVNTELCTNVYEGLGSNSNTELVEADIDSVKAYESTWQNDYNDVAIVVLAREGGEGNDLLKYSTTETYEDGSARHFLDLSENEEALIEYLMEQKEAGIFGKVVVIISTEYQMELGFLEEYDIDAAIQVGECGSYGCTAIGEVLTGEVNPSGHLTDTYAANSVSAPATTYSNQEDTIRWTNYEEINEANPDDNEANGDHIDWYIIYAEGIYVGYRYYETRYEDTVMGTGNADSTEGSSDGEAWNYEEEMMYTFGYGLSYTTFEQTIDSVTYDEESDTYTMEVTVTNTGDVAGKDVVEVYAQTPYGDYEKENLVEKSSVQLVAYDKTDSIEPGASQTLTISVSGYFLASYDSNGAQTYILSAGDYYLSIGDDAHDALNNILAAKGYTTADGMTEEGDASKTYTWTQEELDTETYSTSIYTDAEVTNAFDEADITYYGYDFTYLSRSDWEGTYPVETVELEATEEIIEGLADDWYDPADYEAVSVDDFTQEADNGLTLLDMLDVDFDDDETWNLFLDEFSVTELANLMTDSVSAQVVADLDVVGNARIDDNSSGGGSARFVSEANTARTWNLDLATQHGYLEGVIAGCLGYDEVWYGGGDLHRTPFGGRADQYWSEDSTLSYYMGYVEAEAMQSTGVSYCVKHFTLNDQETEREGVSTFAQEQAIREIYLRNFEGSFAGGALSTMCGLNRIGITCCAKNSSLLTTVLKTEWGFKGHVTNDGYVGLGYQVDFLENIVAGMDYACMDTSGDFAAAVVEAVEDGDGYILQCLRDAAKRNLYVMAHSVSINEVYSGGSVYVIVPGWQLALMVANVIGIAGFVVFTVLAVVSSRRKKRTVKSKEEV
ncbi:MAG: glycoside hydrolase family 3 C-terminal domain-containing protein [Lachnospiraceae bacterium]|nr:glycoside hydrolase family 3 C-terminal domain-containing protein [Lachnospiraceae bacterium]